MPASPATQSRLEGDAFIIENYHDFKPFSNFLPGVAGLWGTPLWSFWVNRGQAVSSFGTRNKNHAILEFQSANSAHQRVADEGFRTFVQLLESPSTQVLSGVPAAGPASDGFYEPFRRWNPGYETTQRLIQRADLLRLEEKNQTLGLSISVDYFTLPSEPYAALIRRMEIRNDSGRPLKLRVLDGLPQVVPFGLGENELKTMPYISQGYLKVELPQAHCPFFTVGNVPGDESETRFVTEGHLCFAFSPGETELLPMLIDPKRLFGEMGDRSRPWLFAGIPGWRHDLPQDRVCQFPCAFALREEELAPGATLAIHSFWGMVRNVEEASRVPNHIMTPGLLERKATENAALTRALQDGFFTVSGLPQVDAYTGQNHLDNSLRGGVPIPLPSGEKNHVYHVFSRKHGDLERDYNFFQLEPSYFSQGNGNFRDVCQNRRNDGWFHTASAGENLRFFFEMLQLDGFNPLLIEGARFSLEQPADAAVIVERHFPTSAREAVSSLLSVEFTPGGIFSHLQQHGLPMPENPAAFLEELLARSHKRMHAEFGHGYWSDHWMYVFDLLDRHLALFPDRFEELVLREQGFRWYDTDVRVLPRESKHVLNAKGQVRHLESLTRDEAKGALLQSRPAAERHWVRTESGRGTIYQGNLLHKLLGLFANKLASLSPSGIGLDMEGGRPGWCDSVNGIPSLFAAGIPEVCRLYDAIHGLHRELDDIGFGHMEGFVQQLPVELADLAARLTPLMARFPDNADTDDEHAYWDASWKLKEAYRERIQMGLAGEEAAWSPAQVLEFLAAAEKRLTVSLKKSVLSQWQLPATYVTHQASAWEKTGSRNASGLECVRITRFEPHFFAPFLEGAALRLSLQEGPEHAKAIYDAVRKSPLFDRKLGMYKIDSLLEKESPEQGRTGGWRPGWFENESVFVHVEFKYLLQMLRAGLYDEFFADIRYALPPFLDPEVYGRSPLENVSFIASSAHERESFHGRGMQPRLSGNNAEWLHMALILSFGEKPFTWSAGHGLRFRPVPVLPEEFFCRSVRRKTWHRLQAGPVELELPADSYTALFRGVTPVTYLNPGRKPTYGPGAVRPVQYRIQWAAGSEELVAAEALHGPEAERFRAGEAARLFVELK